MGRIIPYIMENKIHVWNHQPAIHLGFLWLCQERPKGSFWTLKTFTGDKVISSHWESLLPLSCSLLCCSWAQLLRTNSVTIGKCWVFRLMWRIFWAKSTDVFHSSPNRKWHPRRSVRLSSIRTSSGAVPISGVLICQAIAPGNVLPLKSRCQTSCGIYVESHCLDQRKKIGTVLCIAMYYEIMTDKSDSIGILSIKLLRILMAGVLLFFSSLKPSQFMFGESTILTSCWADGRTC